MATVSILYVDNMREGYTQIAREVLSRGEAVAPRGIKTWELIAPTIVLADPTDALPVGIGRKLSLKIAAIEALQLIAGQGAPDLVVAASANFKQYREDDGTFWGNYGERMGLQWFAVHERLTYDPESRQGVITLWRPEKDLLVDGKRDYPCTVGFQFLIRDEKLDMITTMRSNDVWKGLAYDVFQFTQLQINLAATLRLDVGRYIHRPGSLHVYHSDLENVMSLCESPKRGPMPEVQGSLYRPGVPPMTVISYARNLLEGHDREATTPAGQWYRDQMEKLR